MSDLPPGDVYENGPDRISIGEPQQRTALTTTDKTGQTGPKTGDAAHPPQPLQTQQDKPSSPQRSSTTRRQSRSSIHSSHTRTPLPAPYPCVDTAEELYGMLWEGGDLMGVANAPPVTNRQLLKALSRLYWKQVAWASTLFVVQAIAILSTPICVYMILLWHEGEYGAEREDWIGYTLVAAFAVLQLLGFAALNQMKRVARNAGIASRATLEGVLYSRVLFSPICGHNSPTGGELAAMFGADMDAILHLWTGILGLIFGPIEILIIVGELFYFVQEAALGAIGVVVVVMVIFRIVGGIMEKHSGPRAKLSDDRCHIVHEYLQGTKVVKANAWEDQFAAKISAVRNEESAKAQLLNLLMGALNVSGNNSIDVISLAIVSIYTLGMGNVLVSSITFTIWIVLGILHGKIFHFPGYFDEAMTAWTSITRVAMFISREGIKTGSTNENAKKPADMLLTLDNATFAWPVAMGANHKRDYVSEVRLQEKKQGLNERESDSAAAVDIDSTAAISPVGAAVGNGRSSVPDVHVATPQTSEVSKRLRLRRRKPKAQQTVRSSVSSRVATVDDNVETVMEGAESSSPLGAVSEYQSDTAEDLVVCLNDVTLAVPRGCLMALVGTVASGKSSLLQGLLGEVPIVSGIRTRQDDRVAYGSQQTWIFQGTIRDNILFGEPYDVNKYQAVVYACALSTDFANQVKGDLTRVQASSLSGGQKQRIGIARAAYSSTRLVLMDDPFSALDYHVGAHVFNECFLKLMKDRTVVFTTNFTRLLDRCDLVGVVGDRSVVVDTLQQLTAKGSGSAEGAPNTSDVDEQNATSERIRYQNAFGILNKLKGDDEIAKQKEKTVEEKTMLSEKELLAEKMELQMQDEMMSLHSNDSFIVDEDGEIVYPDLGLDFDEDVPRPHNSGDEEEGFLALMKHHNVAWHLVSGTNGFHWLLFIVACLVVEVGCVEVQLYLLSVWADKGEDGTIDRSTTEKYVIWYAGLIVIEFIGAYARQVLNGIGTVRASNVIHDNLLTMITSVPLSFFQSGVINPSYVLNLFSRDHKFVDQNMFMGVEFLLMPLTYGSALAVAVALIIPWTLILMVVTVAGIVFLLRYHKRTTRQSELLIASTKLPLVQCVSQTGEGVATIRAYGRQENFMTQFGIYVDANTNASITAGVSMTTTSTLADILGSVYNVGVALLIVAMKNDVSSGDAGFMLTNAAFSALTVNLMVYRFLGMEELASTRDKLLYITSTAPHEAAAYNAATLPAKDWPSKGSVQVTDLVVRYAPHLDPVLKGISFSCKPGEKLGVVGRTGAGKSSLMLGLTRLLELDSGVVRIDDIDVSTLGVRDYRERLTVISQEPLFFSGSVRQNLDPFNTYSDEKIWTALGQAELADTIMQLPQQLNYYIAELGANMSIGQLQLLSLARAILQQPTVMLMDEATASLDLMTDRLIQKTIRLHFHNATVIQVAHRLDTVIDSDRVLVLDQGLIVEQGSPHQLLQDTAGIFYGMVQKSDGDAQRLTSEAATAHRRRENQS